MNVHFPASRRTWPGLLVNLAVVVVVLALAGAAFVLSYSGLHAIVLQAGVSARLARIYPGLFDALLVVACVAAVMLRDARWWARCYAWLVIVVVVAVVGAADAAHAMNVTLRHRTIEGVVAAVPWVIVLLGFSLMLVMLRQSRARHVAAKAPAAAPAPAAPAAPELPWVQEAALAREAPALPQAAPAPEPADAFEPYAADTHEADAPDTHVADAGEAPEADAAAAEPAPAPVSDEEHAAEHATATAEEHEQVAQPGAAADAGSVPDEQENPVAEDQDAESEAPLSVLDYFTRDEEADRVDSGHPATVPGQVIDDDDAPPFATAPFATVPRLNRVRSTPTPPEDDDEDE